LSEHKEARDFHLGWVDGTAAAGHEAGSRGTRRALNRGKRMMATQPPTPAKTVLLVEDEVFIRLWAAEELTDAGYAVVEAAHAQEALDVLVQSPETFGVVFTDVQMPGAMDGIGLAHHASTHWPWIGIVIASARPKTHQPPIPEHWRFVDKPYRLEHVVGHIAELLAA